ncbi:MAG TPA: ABC transporter ATP-binding protein, partial [Clostridia bacterium]|nr:ABC transporter ATP-binding protein [Clostridia bacterium]
MGEKPKDFKGTFRKLARQLTAYRLHLVAVMILAIGSSVFAVVGPKVLGNATTAIYEGLVRKIGGNGGIDFASVGRTLLTMLLLYLVSAAFSFVQGFIMSGVTQRTAYRLRRDLSDKLHRMPMQFFDKQTHGEVLSRITNDVDTLSMSMNQVMGQVITSVATVVGVLYMMFSISGWMTLIALITLPLSALGAAGVIKRSQKHFRRQQESLGHVNGQVEEVFGGHVIVKAFNAEAGALKAFDKDNDALYDSAWKSQFLSGLMMPIAQTIGNLGYVLVAIFGGVLASRGRIAVGDIQAFIQYVRQFNQPVTQLAQMLNMVQSMLAAAERVFILLEEPEED